MSNERTPRRKLYSLAAAIGLALGTMGVAAAVSAPSQPAAAQAEQQATAGVEDVDGVQEPAPAGSIEAPEDETLSEADEAASLAGRATLSASDAEAAALAAVPGGTVDSVELGNENGSVVFQVNLTDANGGSVEVKVDAGNGSVLDTETGGDDEAANEAEEANEAEANEADENELAESEGSGDEADGIDHEFEGEEIGDNGDGVADADDATEAVETGTSG